MIKYTKGNFKYQLRKKCSRRVDIIGITINLDFIRLTPIGILIAKKGYVWDGPSGPTIDDKYNMEASLFHDVLAELMRQGKLPLLYLEYSNQLLRDICLEKGMSDFRADYYYTGVSLIGEGFAHPDNKRKVYVIE